MCLFTVCGLETEGCIGTYHQRHHVDVKTKSRTGSGVICDGNGCLGHNLQNVVKQSLNCCKIFANVLYLFCRKSTSYDVVTLL